MKSTTYPRRGELAHFPAYRAYEERWTEVNDGLMLMFSASRIALAELEQHHSSSELLSDIFPEVPAVRRSNFRADIAVERFKRLDAIYAMTAIPMVLAVHEELLKESRRLLMEVGVSGAETPPPDGFNFINRHQHIGALLGAPIRPLDLELIEQMWAVRVGVVHLAGQAKKLKRLSPAAERQWTHFTGEAWPKTTTDALLSEAAVRGCLAVTKRIARHVNIGLIETIPANEWLRLIASDLIAHSGGWGQSATFSRRVRKYGRMHYPGVDISTMNPSTCWRNIQRAL